MINTCSTHGLESRMHSGL